jgi:AmmeMemoRadiSam system protein A/AmmeMemoRadiSam system protein B
MLKGAFMCPHPPVAVHEIGKGEEEKILSTIHGYEAMADRIAVLRPDTIIVSSPHAVMYSDYFNVSSGSHAWGDFGQFNASRVSFEKTYDEEFTRKLNEELKEAGFPGGTEYDREKMLDHGTMVPLYFIDQKYTDYQLVRVSLSGLSLPMHYRFGMILRRVSEELDRNVVFVASGDLSHCQKEDGPYGYQPEGPAYDARIMKTMGSGNFEELLEYEPAFLEKAEECGHRSFTILAGFLDRTAVKPEVISHEATFGVGYGVVLYTIEGKDPSRNFLDQYEQKENEKRKQERETCDPCVRLAYASIDAWTQDHQILPLPDDLPDELTGNRAGAFVSLHEYGQLRGCIGTISPIQDCLGEEIIHNAISACSRDPRFEPVRREELSYLQISVDVLSEAEPVPDSSYLDVKKYGVIVSTEDGRKGLLLPDLDNVDTVEDQISIAAGKGGISLAEDYHLERFEVKRHV